MLCWSTAVLVSCGGRVGGVPELPARALPGHAGPLLTLDAETVSADALDPAELLGVLEDAGFEAARQRTWTDPEHGRRASVRVLAFDDPEGADSYLGWLRSHTVDVIGPPEETAALDLPSPSFLAVHEPSGCCAREGRIYLAAWRTGSTVISIEVGGRHPQRRDAQELASALDAAI